MPLPKDKPSLEQILEELSSLKDNLGFLHLQDKYSRLSEQANGAAESAVEPALVFRSQGEAMAYRKAIRAYDDLKTEVKASLSSLVEN